MSALFIQSCPGIVDVKPPLIQQIIGLSFPWFYKLEQHFAPLYL